MPRTKLNPHRRLPIESEELWTLISGNNVVMSSHPLNWHRIAMEVVESGQYSDTPQPTALLKVKNALHVIFRVRHEYRHYVLRLQPDRTLKIDLENRGITLERILNREVVSEPGMVGILPNEFVMLDMKEIIYNSHGDQLGISYSKVFGVHFTTDPEMYMVEFSQTRESSTEKRYYVVQDMTLIELE